MGDMPQGLSDYELRRWEDIQFWKTEVVKPTRVPLPRVVREQASNVMEKVNAAWHDIPGNDAVEEWVAKAINGSFHMMTDLVAKTVDEKNIVEAVNRGAPRPAEEFGDFVGLDLRFLDAAAPDQKIMRALLAAGHGAATGFVAGGATAAGAASGGMGALPAAGAVAGLAVVDAGALLGNMIQASALIGAHYGFDPRTPQEHGLLMSMLGAGVAKEGAKVAAMMRVRDLALSLAAQRTLEELGRKQLFNLLRRIYALLMLKTAKRNIAKGVPVLGIGLGAGINYNAVRHVVETAQHLYPERFLLQKYGDGDAPTADVVDVIAGFDEMVDEGDEGVLQKLDELPLSDSSVEEQPDGE